MCSVDLSCHHTPVKIILKGNCEKQLKNDCPDIFLILLEKPWVTAYKAGTRSHFLNISIRGGLQKYLQGIESTWDHCEDSNQTSGENMALK